MADFKNTLYEGVLFAFGKVLAKYNTFAQDAILKDVGKEILEYLNENGFHFEESGKEEDIEKVMELFLMNGFSDIEIEHEEHGDIIRWKNLYGFNAYAKLQEFSENPFLSCPLNACLFYVADKYGKTLKLHSKDFNLTTHICTSKEEIVEKDIGSTKPFDSLIIENARLYEIAEERAKKLEKALNEVKTLRGLLPICSSCKKIRDDKGYWNQIDTYVTEHSEAEFSHGICPDCAKKIYPEAFDGDKLSPV